MNEVKTLGAVKMFGLGMLGLLGLLFIECRQLFATQQEPGSYAIS